MLRILHFLNFYLTFKFYVVDTMYTCMWLRALGYYSMFTEVRGQLLGEVPASHLLRAWPLSLFCNSEYLPPMCPSGSPVFTSHLTIRVLELQTCVTAFGFFMWVSWVPGVEIRWAGCTASAVSSWVTSLASQLLLDLSRCSWTSSVGLILCLFHLFSF